MRDHRAWRMAALAAVLALGAAACADSGDEERVEPTVTVADYSDEAALVEGAPDDRSLPPELPSSPTGSYGFSRYVFNNVEGEIVPTLIEGPRGEQVRCQELDRECSFSELRALYESGDPIPDYLGMDRSTLGRLVDQLEAVQDAVDEYPTLEEACEVGFSLSSSQNPNMGIHAVNPFGTTLEFDPSRPQMVLYAKEGGERLTQAEQGECVNGEWTGEPGYESVGAVFTLLMSEEHPDAFAGPIDNWHIHFNTCAGSQEEGRVESVEDLATSTSRDAFNREACEASGGVFQDIIPTWMMHAYVDEEHDAQGGVFAMFNPSIWPVVDDPARIEELRTTEIDGAVNASINNFEFGAIEASVGDQVAFSNSDSVPHTVTSGRPSAPTGSFDSGLFAAGEVFSQTFDEPGEYEIFCALHPQMTGTVVVSE